MDGNLVIMRYYFTEAAVRSLKMTLKKQNIK
ncbi:hypothetical protein SAMN05421821_11037 [Mucilaginibacter lappiensis]|uniref:Uncharacterized protein n=1 Tax=Mucilaginibacter lappiensis TaxID=354630 RepID=A0A1N7CUX2_9SPHI|nr:hypothetical protein [Mucilaginibacter lappiensis]MBB6128855.1 hypothetical protein [Mucilaginibacter lappiensis]SIR67371.1 hypothetical protein SAMN05421821_11037 [Mucilaginibacter lappiensis]